MPFGQSAVRAVIFVHGMKCVSLFPNIIAPCRCLCILHCEMWYFLSW